MKKLITLVFIASMQLMAYAQRIVPQQDHLVLGERTVLWIRGVNPSTSTWDGIDAEIEEVNRLWDDYIRRNSYNQASVANFDITPVYEFNATDPGDMTTQLQAKAEADGFNVNNYNTVAYHFAGNVAIAGGAVGSGNGLRGTMLIPTAATSFFSGIVHEGIHTMGMGHAEGLDGNDKFFPGINRGGVDPYFFMGSEGPDARLKAELNAYFKYRLGWLSPSNVAVQSTQPARCVTHRIYKLANIQNFDRNRTYAMQLGTADNRIWVSFEPETFNLEIQREGNTGALVHFLPLRSPAVTRLLDAHPNSLTGSGVLLTVADFWDAAFKEGEQFTWETATVTITGKGGTGDNQWIDVEVCNCIAITGDDDNDGVCNFIDVCSSGDDNMDSDADEIPDACDQCPNDADNDENKNFVCDNVECLSNAKESFNYMASPNVISVSGNENTNFEGWNGTWFLNSEKTTTAEIVQNSLTHPSVTSSGNKLRIKHDQPEQLTSLIRRLDSPFKNGESFWIDFIIKGNEIGYGGVFIEPQELHELSVGKSWITDIGIANIPSGVFLQKGVSYWVVAKWTLQTTGTKIELWVNPTAANFNENRPLLSETSGTTLLSVDRIEIVHSLNRARSDYELDEITVACNPPTILTACPQVGRPCNDNEACTINDVFDANCNCYGELNDADNDGICDLNDPNITSCTTGATCDDNDACTVNDILDSDCNCSGTFLDANNNTLCDNTECANTALESFEYPENSSLNNANGGNGFTGPWNIINTFNGEVEIEKGSLIYEELPSRGNRLRIRTRNESNAIDLRRNTNIRLGTQDTLWVSFLYKANQLRNGGVWLRLDNRQDIAIGKRFSTFFGIDNNSNDIPVMPGVINWVVTQYVTSNTGVAVKAWINPTATSFDIDQPDLTKTTIDRLLKVDFITLSIEPSQTAEYEFDEFQYSCQPPYPLLQQRASGSPSLSIDDVIETASIAKIYPNPTTDIVYIEGKQNNTLFNIEILSLTGQVLLREEKVTQIDLSQLNPNMYFIRFTEVNSLKKQIKKVIKIN